MTKGHEAEPSLEICASDAPAQARLRAAKGREADLRNLALRFGSSIQRSPGVIEVDLDDLLGNLVALASWPDPAGVSWEAQ